MDAGAGIEGVFVILMEGLEVSDNVDSCGAGGLVTGVVDGEAGTDGSPS